MTKAGTVFVGVRFRPSAGGQVLSLPLSELRDQRVPLADLLPAPPAAARDADPGRGRRRVLDMTGALIADGTPDPAIGEAACPAPGPVRSYRGRSPSGSA